MYVVMELHFEEGLKFETEPGFTAAHTHTHTHTRHKVCVCDFYVCVCLLVLISQSGL